MNDENLCRYLSRFAAIAAAGLTFLAADVALAKSGGGNGHRGIKMSDKKNSDSKRSENDKHSGKKKDHDKYAEKHGRNCGIVPMRGCGSSSKDPVGNTRPTPGKTPSGGSTTGSNVPPPAAPPSSVVRDHRPGGNAADPVPGTIVRDHRNSADGTPMQVVSSKGGVTVYRPVKPAAKKPVIYNEVPFVH